MIRRMPFLAVLSVVAAAALGPESLPAAGAPAAPVARLAIKEVSLGKKLDGTDELAIMTSDDGCHVACTVRRGDKSVVVVDGAEGKPYDNVEPHSVVFSPDSKRVAYVATRDKKNFVVLDGVEGQPYDMAYNLRFSPDSKRLAFQANRGNGKVVVVDGREGQAYDWVGLPVFSPDSKRAAFMATRNKKGFVVLDGVEGKAYDAVGAALDFSPDSKRTAFVAEQGDKSFVVTDGAEGKPCDGVRENKIFFSPDSRRVAYVAIRKGPPSTQSVVCDGAEDKPLGGECTYPQFSPDSRHVTYRRGLVDRNWETVVDGTATPGKWPPVYSPDGKRTACPDPQGGVAVDGAARMGRGTADAATIVFSPDSKRVGFWTWDAGSGRCVVDGVEGPPSDEYTHGPLLFSPDSLHFAYMARVKGADASQWHLVVDGAEGGVFTAVSGAPRLAFKDARHLHAVVMKGGEYVRLDIEIPEGP